MKALDQLINQEERRIDELMQMRNHTASGAGTSRPDPCICSDGDIDYGIQKAYEQLAIYKIRKFMGF